MSPVRESRVASCEHWAGTLADVFRVVQLAEQVTASATNKDVDVSILIDWAGSSVQLDDVGAATNRVSDADASLITSINAELGEFMEGPYTVIKWGSNQTLRVSGQDRTKVDGVFAQVAPEYKRGEERYPSAVGRLVPGLMVFVVSALALVLLFASVRTLELASFLLIASLSVIIAVPISILVETVLGPWMFPRLQLLRPSEQPRWDRLRRRFTSAFLAIILSVGGTVIGALILNAD